jgi:hypothetical protein
MVCWSPNALKKMSPKAREAMNKQVREVMAQFREIREQMKNRSH